MDYLCQKPSWNMGYRMYLGNATQTRKLCKKAMDTIEDDFRLFVHVNGSTGTSPSFWRKSGCSKFGFVDDRMVIKVTMGNITDYFRPTKQMLLCEFLVSRKSHEWTPSPCDDWHVPTYSFKDFGGSAVNWPAEAISGDKRPSITFWGGQQRKGGCCCKSYTNCDVQNAAWGKEFKMYIGNLRSFRERCEQYQTVNGKLKLWAHIPAKADTSDRSWIERGCTKLGSVDRTLVMKIRMGRVEDFFRPQYTMSFCEFLSSPQKFQWTDSVCGNWKIPLASRSRKFRGGSLTDWPKKINSRRHETKSLLLGCRRGHN
jgi:hypothetical protein